MATPNSSANANAWSAPSPQATVQPAGGDDFGLQARPMGLKVHYTFDRENQVHCLARWPHVLQVQTMALDERTSIGVIDLRTCLQAVTQCSPEIVNQHDIDYSIYATDYSEQDWPLVGQGLLSWALDLHVGQPHPQQQQKLVTGRVMRNLMAILSNGSRETLEVKLKLTAIPRIHHPSDFGAMDSLDLSKFAPTPTDAASEWHSFIQSNSILGHSANVASMPSPALPPAQLSQPNSQMGVDEQRFADTRHESAPPQLNRAASIPPQSSMPQAPAPNTSIVPSATGLQRVGSPALAPRPTEMVNGQPINGQPVRPPTSRPSSRVSRSRNRQPTGRPRGRPRKKPQENGSTSAAEEATDGDEGPQKKRAKVTKTEYNIAAPFGSAPDSLRVAASISGSLRNMRPVGSGETVAANHLQDVPRAPTPVPDGPLVRKQQQRVRTLGGKAKTELLGEPEGAAAYQRRMSQPMAHDARSPDSVAQSPDQAYSPGDSPADLGSSPPVPRANAYMPSSPMPSSPILPAMPKRQIDSGFMSGGIDDVFDEDDLLQELPLAKLEELPREQRNHVARVSSLPPAIKASNGKTGRPQVQQHEPNFPFQEVQPGPPELLPTTSIFNPHGKAKTLNRPPNAAPLRKNPSLKRSNTAPNPPSESTPMSEPPASQQMAESQLPACAPQPSGPPPQSAIHQATSAPNIEAVLHQALIKEVGTETDGPSHPPPELSAPLADMMPLPIQSEPTEPTLPLPAQPPSRPISRPASRPASRGPSAPMVPASDPGTELSLPMPRPFMSEAPCSLDDEPPRYSKNQVKKQSIKERLETAIEKGESPPFCSNCGAIETPTWRKIWTQEHRGVPGPHQLSDKPGCVTAVDVLERDTDGKTLAYRLVKKHLGPTEDKKFWIESLLCNPCGIWLAKTKGHRPPERWDKDAARLGQPRRKRDNRNGNGKGKKARSKSDAQFNPTSEAYFTTDPLGPADLDSPKEKPYEAFSFPDNGFTNGDDETAQYRSTSLNLRSSPKHRGPGSTHSRGSGTADSPIAIEDDLGTTRRLLFPSPRKDGQPKVLGELTANHGQMNVGSQELKSAAAGKENTARGLERPGTPVPGVHDDLDQELFGTPPNRPSTPPAKSASSGVFKTPTRPTPSHRPITRSISRSIRSVRSAVKSPAHAFGQLLRTPSKTPRSSASALSAIHSSTGKRRSPRNAHLHAHFVVDDFQLDSHLESPCTATLYQLLSEANDFTAGSSAHGLVDIDVGPLSHLPSDLDHDALTDHLTSGHALEFGNFLSTDLPMPSSPPLLRGHGGSLNFAASLNAGDLWGVGAAGEMDGVEMSELQ